MFKKSQSLPFYIFRHYATYRRLQKNFQFFLMQVLSKRILDTLKSFCYFWALIMAPTWAVPGLFRLSKAKPNSIQFLKANFTFFFEKSLTLTNFFNFGPWFLVLYEGCAFRFVSRKRDSGTPSVEKFCRRMFQFGLINWHQFLLILSETFELLAWWVNTLSWRTHWAFLWNSFHLAEITTLCIFRHNLFIAHMTLSAHLIF